jgi:hypothetical protein
VIPEICVESDHSQPVVFLDTICSIV